MKSLAFAHRLLPVAATCVLLGAVGPSASYGAAPTDEVRAAVALAAGKTEVKAITPKAFLNAISAVFAGAPAEQIPACAAAAAELRPDLADGIAHAAISALHLPGQLPDPALVAAVVKAVLTVAPDMTPSVVSIAMVAAPEARENIVQAARAAAPARSQLATDAATAAGSARFETLPFSLVRLTDVTPATLAAPSAATAPAAAAAPVVAAGAVNPANVSSPRIRRPPVSGF